MTENFEDDFALDPELERFLDALSALILADERRTSVLNIVRFQECGPPGKFCGRWPGTWGA